MIAARSGFRIVQHRIASLRRAVAAEVEDRNRLIYHILRGGVVVSVAVLLFGFVLIGVTRGAIPERSIAPRFLGGELYRFKPDAYLSLGVLVLIFTPVARVFLSILAFIDDRDPTYVLLTGIVFVNLLTALLVLA